MIFSRRTCFALVLLTGVLIGRPSTVFADTSVMRCQCNCTVPGSFVVQEGGPSCETPADCTENVCQTYCASAAPPGAVTHPPATMHVYYCSDTYVPPPTPIAPSPAEGTVPTGAGETPSGSSGSSSTRTAADTPSNLGGTVPTASSGLTLRLILPACTANGQCSLTDIINTGVRFANLLIALSGILFLGVFLIAGARLILFAYSGKEVAQTKTMLTGAVTGIVIIMIAGVAVRFVSSSLGVSSATTALPGSRTTTTNRLTPPATR